MTSLRKERTLDEVARLRAAIESSRAIVERARQRAAQAAENARSMRVLLGAHQGSGSRRGAPHADIWAAAARELTKAARERDLAFGVLSHELRQALAAAMAAERLLTAADATTAARARQVLERQLRHMTMLVDTLLDFSRLTLGSVGPAMEDVDLHAIVREAFEGIEP